MTNPYDVLQVSPTASHDEVRQAYKARLLETHPDKSHGNRTEFEAVHLAYQQLTSSQHFVPSIIHDTITLSDMDTDIINAIYPCRCGTAFIVPLSDIRNSSCVVVACQGCSLSLCIVDDSPDG